MDSKERHLKTTTNIRIVLVIALCLLFVMCLGALFNYPVPEENRSAVDILVGAISTLLGMVFTYYFGNSAGSRSKHIEPTEQQHGDDEHVE